MVLHPEGEEGGATGGGGCGCNAIGDREQEEKIRITYTSPTCSTPTAQPTALVLAPSGTSIDGSFTLPNQWQIITLL
jgi:hypothetical protein